MTISDSLMVLAYDGLTTSGSLFFAFAVSTPFMLYLPVRFGVIYVPVILHMLACTMSWSFMSIDFVYADLRNFGVMRVPLMSYMLAR